MKISEFVSLVAVVMFGLGSAPGFAADLVAGSRVLIEASGRDNYEPNVVECDAPSGICIRDTRGTPPNNPVVATEEGQRVEFTSWGVTYVFKGDGTGVVRDTSDKDIGTFSWSQ